jgi:hypothetical protein
MISRWSLALCQRPATFVREWELVFIDRCRVSTCLLDLYIPVSWVAKESGRTCQLQACQVAPANNLRCCLRLCGSPKSPVLFGVASSDGCGVSVNNSCGEDPNSRDRGLGRRTRRARQPRDGLVRLHHGSAVSQSRWRNVLQWTLQRRPRNIRLIVDAEAQAPFRLFAEQIQPSGRTPLGFTPQGR